MKWFLKFIAKTMIFLVVLYAFLGFILIPYAIVLNFSKIVKQQTSANAYLEKVFINPFTFEVELKNLLINDNKNKPLVYFKSFKVDLEVSTIFDKTIVINTISMQNLKSNITIRKDKLFNFQYILDFISKNQTTAVKNNTTNKSDIPFIKINTINLDSNRIVFKDETKSDNFIVQTKPFDIKLKNISTKPNELGTFKTSIKTKETLNLNVNSSLSLVPLNTKGTISIDTLKIDKIYSYIKDNVQFNITGRKIDFSTDYNISIDNKKSNVNLENINTKLSKLTFSTNKISVNTNSFKSTIKNIKLIQSSDKPASLEINDITSNISSLIFTDKSYKNGIPLKFENLKNSINKVTLDKKSPINFKLYFDTPKQGSLLTKGSIIQEPLNIKSSLFINKLALTPYLYYVQHYANINIEDGLLSTKLDILTTKNGKKIDANIKGDIKLNKLHISHSITQKDLIKFDSLVVSKLNYKNNSLFVDDILLNSLETNFKMKKNKTTNFDNIIIQNNKSKKAEKTSSKNNSKFNYFISHLEVKNGQTGFTDLSLPLPFTTKIKDINIDLNAISSKDEKTKLDIKGKVDEYGLANIKGSLNINDFKKDTNIAINFENLDLISATPYSGKFLGQKISSGKLWLDLNYKIKDANLNSSNSIRIKTLEFGENVESNESVNLPLGLAVALLEDSDGFIDVNVPVSGDINNPEFHLSGAIWSAVGNVVKNIITAPFKFLASLLGVSSDELGNVDFDFGESTLLPPQIETLNKLIKALNKKPKLSIELNPIYDEKKDMLILQKNKFDLLTNKKDKKKIIKKMFLIKFGKKELAKIIKKQDKKDITPILSKRLLPTITISKVELETLAKNRANSIYKYMLGKKLQKDKVTINKTIGVFDKQDTKRISMKLNVKIKK